VKSKGVYFVLLAVAAGVVACNGASSSTSPGLLPYAARPLTGNVPIKHVVIVIQENRSFDNFFATFPGADGATVGQVAAMPSPLASACASIGGAVITKPTTVPLTEVNLIGQGFPGNFGELSQDEDLGHIHSSFQTDRDGGKMDGWDLLGDNANGSGAQPVCTYPYQYVNPSDIAPYWDLAKQYVLADHTFQTQASGSFTAHQDLIAAGTQISSDEALIDNPSYFPWGCDAYKTVVTAIIKRGGKVYRYGGPFPCLSYTTLRDLLDAKNVSWKFYAMPVQSWKGCQHGDTPGLWSAFDAIKAVRYSSEWYKNVTKTNTVFFTDISKGELPAVSWITPDGPNSDHPAEYNAPACEPNGPPYPAVDNGPSWVASVVNAIGKSSYWDSTAIVVLWDDWGGFYDHMPPPTPFNWQGGPGFRVPMLIVSPYVKPHVEHTVYSFGSILRFIEDVWDLGTLGKSDAHATSIGNAFDFSMSPRKFGAIPSKYSKEFFIHQKPSGIPPDTE